MLLNALLVVAGIAVAIGGLGARFYLANQLRASHDVWYHLLASEAVRDNDHRLPEQVDHFIFEGPYDYPPLLHVLLSFVPQRTVREWKWTFGPLIDTIHLILLFGVGYFASHSLVAPSIAVALYTATPEPYRHFTVMTPRVLGALLTTVTVLASIYGVVSGNTVLLVVALLGGGLVLLTHKMSTQALFITLIGLTAWRLDPTFLALGIGIVAVALLVSLGHYADVFRSHVAIVNFWRKRIAEGNPSSAFMAKYGRGGPSEDDSEKALHESLLNRFKQMDVLRFLLSDPWLYAVPVVLFPFGVFAELTPFQQAIAVWSLTMLVTAVLTQYVPVFKLIGEGQKYYNWAAFPVALTLGIALNVIGSPLLYLVTAGLVGVSGAFTYLFMSSRVDNAKRFNLERRGEVVLDRLRASDRDRVMCIPHGISFTVAYLADKTVLWHDSTTAYEEGTVYYPMPEQPLDEIADGYDIEFVIIDTELVVIDETYFADFEVLVEDSGYLLLGRRSLENEA